MTVGAALHAEALCLTYDGCSAPAVTDARLRLEPGERVALIGPSGGGKTSLLRLLEGSVAPSSGRVTREGHAVLVYQDLRLIAEESVLTNVCLGAGRSLGVLGGAFGFPRAVQEQARRLLRELGLADFEDLRVGSLSGGQKQRVALARALCSRPAVLLADEPTAALDAENARRILELLLRLQERHGFALLVSVHDPGPMPEFFTRVLRMRGGYLEQAPMAALLNGAAVETEAEAPAMTPAASTGPDRSAQDVRLGSRGSTAAAWATAAGAAALLAALAWSATAVGLRPAALEGALGNVQEFARQLLPGSWAEAAGLPWARLAGGLVQTLQMALVGTALAAAASLPLAVLAARGVSPAPLRVPARLLLNAVRTVPSIFWALLFVALVGLGPIAGVFALATYSIGYLAKFFYEALENVDDRPAQALASLGLGALGRFRHAILPAARPALLGACLFVFEYNVRAASVLGVVGAGGIGQDLMYYFEWREFPAALAGLLLLLGVVVVLDAVSERVRRVLGTQRGG